MNNRLRREALKSSAETIDLLIQVTKSPSTPDKIKRQAEEIELSLQDFRQNLHALASLSLTPN